MILFPLLAIPITNRVQCAVPHRAAEEMRVLHSWLLGALDASGRLPRGRACRPTNPFPTVAGNGRWTVCVCHSVSGVKRLPNVILRLDRFIVMKSFRLPFASNLFG